jgi:hypothetical protein
MTAQCHLEKEGYELLGQFPDGNCRYGRWFPKGKAHPSEGAAISIPSETRDHSCATVGALTTLTGRTSLDFPHQAGHDRALHEFRDRPSG